MSTPLTLSEERIKAAAEKCPDAKRVLTELFPEVFTPDEDATSVPRASGSMRVGRARIEPRDVGEYKGRGVWLSGVYRWEIVTDSLGSLVLVARKA